MIYYSLKEFFDKVDGRKEEYLIKCSYYQIFNDKVYDLLDFSQNSDFLELCEDKIIKGFRVKNLN